MAISRRRLMRGLGIGALGAGALSACDQLPSRGRGRRQATTPPPTGVALGEPETPLVIASIGASHGRTAQWERPISLAVQEALTDVDARWDGLFGQEVTGPERHVQEAAGDDLAGVVADWQEQGVTAVVSSLDEDALVAAMPLFAEAGMVVVDVATAGMSVREDAVQDAGLLFRLAPSTRAIAALYAEEAWSGSSDRGGRPGTVAIVSEDTAQGHSLRDEMKLILDPMSGSIVLESFHEPGKLGDVGKLAGQIIEKKPALLVVHGGPESGALLSALQEATTDENGRSDLQLPVRLSPGGTVDQSEAGLVAEAMTRATGYEPGGDLTDVHVNMMLNADSTLQKSSYAYSQQAYDAVVILCLAAYQALSVEGTAIAAQVPVVLTGAEECDDYGTCRSALRDALIAGGTTTVSYQGRSGAIELGADRDARTGQLRTYSFTGTGALEAPSATGFEVPA